MTKAGRTIRLAAEEDHASWDEKATHPLGSWAWGEFRAGMGIDVVRLVQRNATKLTGAWQITFHKLPATPFTIGYFPKGPMPSKTMLRAIMDIGRAKRAVLIQLEPNVKKEEIKSLRDQTLKQLLSLQQTSAPTIPLRPSHRPLFTKYNFILDIRPSEAELLRSMHHKTRYNIRVAQKHGVVVSEETSEEGFAAYLKLLSETTGRQKFYAHNEAYHRRMWETLSKAGIAKLFTARVNGEAAAAWIIFAFHDTIYYPYGTSSREFRETMAPNLLLWEIIRWGKARGYSFFDLWGALGPTPDQNDPWYGFHRFKEGYRPELVEYVGSFDLVLRPAMYKFYQLADTLRWKILKSK
jgi:lipid II:glycine glycyltransferase (peptidoglycan interpeptide bridge formation enzyme)